jgi:hypothetical protein
MFENNWIRCALLGYNNSNEECYIHWIFYPADPDRKNDEVLRYSSSVLAALDGTYVIVQMIALSGC